MQWAWISAARRSMPAFGPSSSASSTAPASSGSPRCTYGSTATIVRWSIISSAAGTMPAATIEVTARPASLTWSNTTRKVRTVSGRGVSVTTSSVTTANVPSEPIVRPVRSSPGMSSARPPVTTTVPSASTSVMPRTCWWVWPYLRQCGPPAFVAALPPSVDAIWLDGSGA